MKTNTAEDILETKDNVFTVEWRGKADILSLKINSIGKYPLKIYEKSQGIL